MRMPEPMPLGLTRGLAMIRAMVRASLVKSPSGGKVETVFTLIHKGTRVATQLKPYVVETGGEAIDVADLFFEDGTVSRGVPFAFFSLVD
jgi:hypothetical protein